MAPSEEKKKYLRTARCKHTRISLVPIEIRTYILIPNILPLSFTRGL